MCGREIGEREGGGEDNEDTYRGLGGLRVVKNLAFLKRDRSQSGLQIRRAGAGRRLDHDCWQPCIPAWRNAVFVVEAPWRREAQM